MRVVAIVHGGRVGPNKEFPRQYPVGLHSRTQICIMLLIYNAEAVQFREGGGLAETLSTESGVWSMYSNGFRTLYDHSDDKYSYAWFEVRIHGTQERRWENRRGHTKPNPTTI